MPSEVGGERLHPGRGEQLRFFGRNFVVFSLRQFFTTKNDSPEIPNTTGQKITREQNSHGGSDPQTALALQRPTSNGPKNTKKYLASWWLNQPLWKNMLVKMGSSSPIFGVKIKNLWVATTYHLVGYAKPPGCFFHVLDSGIPTLNLHLPTKTSAKNCYYLEDHPTS